MIVHLVQCVFFILPTWLIWYYKRDGEEVGKEVGTFLSDWCGQSVSR